MKYRSESGGVNYPLLLSHDSPNHPSTTYGRNAIHTRARRGIRRRRTPARGRCRSIPRARDVSRTFLDRTARARDASDERERGARRIGVRRARESGVAVQRDGDADDVDDDERAIERDSGWEGAKVCA